VNIDADTANELMSSFEDHYDVMQVSLNKLIHNADDKDLINITFRSMHTIKGNAAMMQVTPLVVYAHAVEETISAIRAGFFSPSHKLCDLLLTAVDRLRDLHTKYLFDKDTGDIDEAAIASTFTAMANARHPNDVDKYCDLLIGLFSPIKEEEEIEAVPTSSEGTPPDTPFDLRSLRKHTDYLSLSEQQAEDLLLFRILSLQVDEQNHFWQSRTDTLLYLALKTSELADKAIDKVQLVAGIYMHDSGMAFVADDIVNKSAKLNSLETKKLQQHPVWGYSILKRMAGWEMAAEMILQHHERIDGDGYPYRKKGSEICEGAKLLAILDAYYAMTNLRADRSHRRSILRALSEINACINTQFDSYWVDIFNRVIRQEVKAGVL
jgi:chemotaxis protein histidine kinase CheA